MGREGEGAVRGGKGGGAGCVLSHPQKNPWRRTGCHLYVQVKKIGQRNQSKDIMFINGHVAIGAQASTPKGAP